MFKKLKILTFLLFLFQPPLFLLAVNCAHPTSVWENVTTGSIGGIAGLLSNLVNYVVDCIAKPSFLGVIVVAGFYIMASRGNPGNIQKGKVALIGGIVGLSIIALGRGLGDKGVVFGIVLGIIIYVISSVLG